MNNEELARMPPPRRLAGQEVVETTYRMNEVFNDDDEVMIVSKKDTVSFFSQQIEEVSTESIIEALGITTYYGCFGHSFQSKKKSISKQLVLTIIYYAALSSATLES